MLHKNFVNAHMEVAAECVPTKLRAKQTIPSETLAVRKKRNVKTATLCNKKNPANINTKKLKKTQSELINVH